MESLLQNKADNFAVEIVSLCKYLQSKNEHIISKQILRSGTSIGANIAEAQYAASRADFINKYQIALKEANETEYWLRLLQNTGYLPQSIPSSKTVPCSLLPDHSSIPCSLLLDHCKELLRLLIASTRTAKGAQK